jgi:hypothetical protein
MIDPETDRISPGHFRNQYAPSFVKLKQHVITGQWLRQIRGDFEAFLRDYVPN